MPGFTSNSPKPSNQFRPSIVNRNDRAMRFPDGKRRREESHTGFNQTGKQPPYSMPSNSTSNTSVLPGGIFELGL
jgi:hypothetical protein